MSNKILTANRLSDGAVVYLTAEGSWSEDLQQAAPAAADREADLIATAQQAVADCTIIEPYLIPVSIRSDRLLAVSQRERIRAAGPTVETASSATAREQAHVSL
tara:strand:- start:399 stop:710 length:312 start_codon:yes stop_codon:yes gene_type:complete